MQSLPGKGEKGRRCNRQACQQPGAVWYNHSTCAYYCRSCALAINEANRTSAQKLYGHDLCTRSASAMVIAAAERQAHDTPMEDAQT